MAKRFPVLPLSLPLLHQNGLTPLDVATNSNKGDVEGVSQALQNYMKESATAHSHHISVWLYTYIVVSEMTSLMFTVQDDTATGLPLLGTFTTESTPEDMEKDSRTADDDTDRKRAITSSGRRGLSEVIH